MSGDWATAVSGIIGGLTGGGFAVLTGYLTARRQSTDADRARTIALEDEVRIRTQSDIDARRTQMNVYANEMHRAWIDGRIQFGHYGDNWASDPAHDGPITAKIQEDVAIIAKNAELLADAIGTPAAFAANDALFVELAQWFIDQPPQEGTRYLWDRRAASPSIDPHPTVGELVRNLRALMPATDG